MVDTGASVKGCDLVIPKRKETLYKLNRSKERVSPLAVGDGRGVDDGRGYEVMLANVDNALPFELRAIVSGELFADVNYDGVMTLEGLRRILQSNALNRFDALDGTVFFVG